MSRRVVLILGQVQGVGFRPFVYETARRLGLTGFVRNQGGGVRIEIEGADPAIDAFLTHIENHPPSAARVDSVRCKTAIEQGGTGFAIEASDVEAHDVPFIPADIAVCEDCLTELFDPHDRRYWYPFLNCTHCGPRLTVICATPYDRLRTSLASFPLCAQCRREYDDPSDRRFHAQPIACPSCGPRLSLRDGNGVRIECDDPLQRAADALSCGKIVAVKSLGGYHLACDAANEPTVERLRLLKQRDAKPLAVMAVDLEAARRLCHVSAEEAALLESAARPIVLLRRRSDRETGPVIAASVAPRSRELGIMLPYTPLHHLLLRAVEGVSLVMTSGNSSDEPIVFDDDEALVRLAGLADLVLTHDRPIVVRCDDSVVRVAAGDTLPIRRSRGYAPAPLQLPIPCTRPLLALGGQQKSTFALARDGHAILSHHLGDLEHLEAYEAYVAAIGHYERLFNIEPELIVHDLHPDYASTRYARRRAESSAHQVVVFWAVQHHHAHLASCLAEHGRTESAIGVVFDGTGYGTDGAMWGGEFLIGDCFEYRRAAHFRYVSLAGGEQAVREPWRMALAYLVDSGVDWLPGWSDVPSTAVQTVRQMIVRRIQSPPTSSVGRLFDAVAALVNLRTGAQYEGQAAVELEWAGEDDCQEVPYRFHCRSSEKGDSSAPLNIDVRPMIVDIAADVRGNCPASLVARRFHATLVAVISQVCEVLREQTGLETVALSGGCFVNSLLLRETASRLTARGFDVLRHRRVPPGDGGLAFGQAAIAAARQSCENPAKRL